jgi:diacylglycerol O-acyltransferase / wax synthase
MGALKRLNALDWIFLAGETQEAMMHVGSLMPFSPPPNAAPGLLRRLMDEVRQAATVYPPWNLKLKYPNFMAHPLQAWVEDYSVDVDYHVRRSALPFPGDERELGILVSRLHSNRIDFRRPPWEVHFIEGLERGRFAIYFKVHHSLVDGYTGIRLLSSSMSTSAAELDTPMFFRRHPSECYSKADAGKFPTLESLITRTRQQLRTTRTIGRALAHTLLPKGAQFMSLVAPMQAPKSVIN